jgi:hypothetical protein
VPEFTRNRPALLIAVNTAQQNRVRVRVMRVVSLVVSCVLRARQWEMGADESRFAAVHMTKKAKPEPSLLAQVTTSNKQQPKI